MSGRLPARKSRPLRRRSRIGVYTLKLRKRAIVHATDAFGNGGAKALTEELQKLGITPMLDQGYTSNSQDFGPVVLAVKKSGAEVLGTYMTVLWRIGQ